MKLKKTTEPHSILGREGERIEIRMSCSGTVFHAVTYALDEQKQNDELLSDGSYVVVTLGTEPKLLAFCFYFTQPAGGTYKLTLTGDSDTDSAKLLLHQPANAESLLYTLALGGDETKGDYG